MNGVSRVCEECGVPFIARVTQPGRFCSRRCGLRHALRVKCGRDVFSRQAQFDAGLPNDRPTNKCWPWTGPLDINGYGRCGNNKAHRVAYELAREQIPDGLTIDHLCFNRACVNPDHLEVVTRGENTKRGFQRHGPKPRQLTKSTAESMCRAHTTHRLSCADLGYLFHLSPSMVAIILRGDRLIDRWQYRDPTRAEAVDKVPNADTGSENTRWGLRR